MEQLILIIHVLAALAIIGLILIQQGKGAEMGASFGSGGSQTLFGSAGSGNVLTRATAVLATIFFCTSLGLAMIASDKADRGSADLEGLPTLQESRDVAPVNDEIPVFDDMPAGDAADMPAAGEFPE